MNRLFRGLGALFFILGILALGTAMTKSDMSMIFVNYQTLFTTNPTFTLMFFLVTALGFVFTLLEYKLAYGMILSAIILLLPALWIGFLVSVISIILIIAFYDEIASEIT